MCRILLFPLDAEPESFRKFGAMTASPHKRRSIFGKALRGIFWLGSTPAQWVGTKNIRQGMTLIVDLARRTHARPGRDPRFRTEERGAFDLPATAFSYGITVAEVERRLSSRRRQTALMAYALAGLGLMFFVAWLRQVLATDGAARRLLLAVDFLPFCLLFMLLAFFQALINFQIRMGRNASWRDYLMTNSGFWPRI